MVSLAPFCRVIYMQRPKDTIQCTASGQLTFSLGPIHVGQVYTSLLPHGECNSYCYSPGLLLHGFVKGGVTLLLQRCKHRHTRIDHFTYRVA